MKLNPYDPTDETTNADTASRVGWSNPLPYIFHWIGIVAVFMIVVPMGISMTGKWIFIGSYGVAPYAIALLSQPADRNRRLRKSCFLFGFLATPIIGFLLAILLIPIAGS